MRHYIIEPGGELVTQVDGLPDSMDRGVGVEVLPRLSPLVMTPNLTIWGVDSKPLIGGGEGL